MWPGPKNKEDIKFYYFPFYYDYPYSVMMMVYICAYQQSQITCHEKRNFSVIFIFLSLIHCMGVCVSPLCSLFCLVQPTVIHTHARAYMIVLCANINAHIMIFAQQNMYTSVWWCCFHSCPVDYYDNSRFWKLHTLTHTHTQREREREKTVAHTMHTDTIEWAYE